MFIGQCKVTYVGPTVSGPTEIKLRPQDNTFTEAFFLSSPGVAREVLATALAAVTSNRLVFCEIPNETTPYSEITRILLDNNA